MAAAAQSTVSLPKYGGSSADNWTDFESLFRSIVEVTGIADAQRVGFLKLHLKDSALQLFHTLHQNTRADLELTITALKNHFCNPNLKEIHHINLKNMKFNHKTESPEEFLVKLQNLALKAYPTPVDIPVAPVDGDVPNDQDRFDRETRENQNRRNFSQMERERHIIRLFKEAMPNFIRLKLLEEPEDATIQELCTKARQKLILRELCPVDDWSRDGFNEMSSENSEKFLSVLTKMSENQNSLENRIDALTQKLNSPQQNSSNTYKDNEQQTWQGNFRGRMYQNRGNRGYSNNHGYQNRNYQKQGWNYYQNNQNRGRYGNNFNRGSYRGRNNFRSNNRGNFSNNYNNNSNNSNFQQQGYQSNETTINTGNSGGHIETTAFSQKVCYSCGYPNHTSRNCEARGKSSTRGGQIPFNSQAKN